MKRELAIFLSAGAMLCAEVATARDAAFERAPYMDASLSIDARLDDLVSRMTLEENVAALSTMKGFNAYEIRDGTLLFDARKVKRLAVIGPNADKPENQLGDYAAEDPLAVETDELFRTNGFKHVRGGLLDVTPYDPKGEKRAGLRPVHTVDKAFIPAKELRNRFRLDTALAGESYNTDIEDILMCVRRCAERNEVFVLTSHGIAPDAKDINMKTEWLERILATAKECGVAVIGFDEL